MPAPLKALAIFSAKALLLYMAVPFLWVDLVLMQAALPGFMVYERPLVLSILVVVVVAAGVSFVQRSKMPMVLALCCLAYSSAFLAFNAYAFFLEGILMAVAGIHFLRRNRFTQPLLALLPVVAGAWVFVCAVYLPVLLGWATHRAGADYGDAIVAGLASLGGQSIEAMIAAPLMVLYGLARHDVVGLYGRVRALRLTAFGGGKA